MPSSVATPTEEISEPVAEALRTLRRGLQRAEGFALFVAVSNSPANTRKIVELLADALPAGQVPVIELGEAIESPLDEVLRGTPEKPGGPLMVVGLEKSNPSSASGHPVLRALNLSRDEWPRKLDRPVVLWVPEYLLELLAREAPDFLDWRSDTLVFSEAEEDDLRAVDSRLWRQVSDKGLQDWMTEAERRARLAELRSRLQGVEGSQETTALVAARDWWLELVRHLIELGEFDQAEDYLEEFLKGDFDGSDISESLFVARASYLLAELLQFRGDSRRVHSLLERAKKLVLESQRDKETAADLRSLAKLSAGLDETKAAQDLYREALSVFEEMGDRRYLALVLKDLALLELSSDNPWQAKKLYQQALTMLQEIGDKHEEAKTLGDLASLSARFGDITEARQLRRKARVVCERLGSGQHRAETLTHLAIASMAGGELREAERLHEEAFKVHKTLGNELGASLAQLALLTLAVKQREGVDHRRMRESWAVVKRLGNVELLFSYGKLWGLALFLDNRRAEAQKVLVIVAAAAHQRGASDKAAEIANFQGRLEKLPKHSLARRVEQS